MPHTPKEVDRLPSNTSALAAILRPGRLKHDHVGSPISKYRLERGGTTQTARMAEVRSEMNEIPRSVTLARPRRKPRLDDQWPGSRQFPSDGSNLYCLPPDSRNVTVWDRRRVAGWQQNRESACCRQDQLAYLTHTMVAYPLPSQW